MHGRLWICLNFTFKWKGWDRQYILQYVCFTCKTSTSFHESWWISSVPNSMVKCNSMPYLTGLIPTLPPWSRNGVALRQADTISFNACISACEGLGVVAVKFVNRLDIFLDMDDGIMNHDSYTLPICCKMANTWSRETSGILQMKVSCEWVRRKFLIRLWVVLWVCEMCIFCRDKRRIH